MKGRAIIRNVMQLHGVGPKDFFGYTRLPNVTKARRIAALEMRDAGMTISAIARLLRRSPSTIKYNVEPVYRERRRVGYLAYYHARQEQGASA